MAFGLNLEDLKSSADEKLKNQKSAYHHWHVQIDSFHAGNQSLNSEDLITDMLDDPDLTLECFIELRNYLYDYFVFEE